MTTVIHQRDRRAQPAADIVWIDRMTIWGNPFSHLAHSRAKIHVRTRQEAVERFTDWWFEPAQYALRAQAVIDLKDKVLVCWCKPQACHGDILARFVNDYYESLPR